MPGSRASHVGLVPLHHHPFQRQPVPWKETTRHVLHLYATTYVFATCIQQINCAKIQHGQRFQNHETGFNGPYKDTEGARPLKISLFHISCKGIVKILDRHYKFYCIHLCLRLVMPCSWISFVSFLLVPWINRHRFKSILSWSSCCFHVSCTPTGQSSGMYTIFTLTQVCWYSPLYVLNCFHIL